MSVEQAFQRSDNHLADCGFGGHRPTLLVYLRGLLDASAATAPKADAVRDWLNAIIFTAALQPDQIENVLTPPPYAFAEVATEVAQSLSQP